MWVSKEEWYELKNRVSALEGDMQGRTTICVYHNDIEYAFPRERRVLIVNAIKALAKHLGVEFKFVPGTPETVTLEKTKNDSRKRT